MNRTTENMLIAMIVNGGSISNELLDLNTNRVGKPHLWASGQKFQLRFVDKAEADKLIERTDVAGRYVRSYKLTATGNEIAGSILRTRRILDRIKGA